jgi:hypothetical protein
MAARAERPGQPNQALIVQHQRAEWCAQNSTRRMQTLLKSILVGDKRHSVFSVRRTTSAMRALQLVEDRKLVEVDLPPPPPPGIGEVTVRIKMVALNHIDVWGWRGMAFAKRKMPLVVGAEASGTVDAIGQGVSRTQARASWFRSSAPRLAVSAGRAARTRQSLRTRLRCARFSSRRLRPGTDQPACPQSRTRPARRQTKPAPPSHRSHSARSNTCCSTTRNCSQAKPFSCMPAAPASARLPSSLPRRWAAR